MRLSAVIKRLCCAAWCAIALASGAQETRLRPATLLQRDVRIVTDLTALKLTDLRDTKDGPWIVAGFSPVKSELRFANDNDKWRFRARQEREPVYIRTVEGDVGETTPLVKDLGVRDTSFFFEFPEHVAISQHRMEYAEFSEDATVVCRFRAARQGAERYRPFYFIPADWRRFVAPAVEFASSLDRGRDRDDERHRRALIEGLSNENPMIVLECWRRMLREGAPTAEALSSALKHDRLTQATVVCDLLRCRPESDAVARVDAVIRLRTSREDLLGIGLGALVAYNSLDLEGATLARELGSRVAGRVSVLPASPAVDGYLKMMLDVVSPS